MNWKELFNVQNAVLLTAITYVLRSIRGLFIKAYQLIMRRFSMSIIVENSSMSGHLLEYIIKLSKYPKSTKILDNNILFMQYLSSMIIGWGSYIIRMDKMLWITINSSTKDNLNNLTTITTISFYGLRRKELFEKIKRSMLPNDTSNLYKIISGSNGLNNTIHEPKIKKMVFGKFVKDVDTAIDKFIKNKPIYEEFGKKYKLILLLYGPPGTGKTSIIKHILNKLGNDTVYYIDGLFSRGNRSANTIAGMINDETIRKDKPQLCVIEDIDKSILNLGDIMNKGDVDERFYSDPDYNHNQYLLMPDEVEEEALETGESLMDARIRIREEIEKSKDNPNNPLEPDERLKFEGYNINRLMQLLDSNISPNNMILLITTNNPHLLPKPMMRTGRIDYKIKVDNLTKDEALEMIKYYKVDLKLAERESYNPAELERLIFDKLTDKNE